MACVAVDTQGRGRGKGTDHDKVGERDVLPVAAAVLQVLGKDVVPEGVVQVFALSVDLPRLLLSSSDVLDLCMFWCVLVL